MNSYRSKFKNAFSGSCSMPQLCICLRLLLLVLLHFHLTDSTTPGVSARLDHIDLTEDFSSDAALRGCECWKWPDCISNCTGNPILQTQMRADHVLLASLPRPFVLMFPYQDRKTRSKYGTSTAGRRGTYFMSTKFWIHLPNQQHVQLRLQKSPIFGPPNSYSTLYYQNDKHGQMFPFASNKLDHCFYNGTVGGNSMESEAQSYVAVDTCHGLRGLIVVDKATYGILPLQCSNCQPGLMPHVLFPQVPSPIERNARLPVFWQPTDVMSRTARRFKKFGDQVYPIRLAVILDHQLFVTFSRKLESCLHYIGAIVNQATKSFLDTPVELKLVRSEIWNLKNRISLNNSIKSTLNHLAAYSVQQVRTNDASREDINKTIPASRFRKRSGPLITSESTASAMEPHNMEILLTTTQFSEAVEYLAVPDSVCTPRALAVIQVNTSETVYHISRLLSLAVAEVLGLKSFPCPDYYSCNSEDLLSKGDKGRIRLALLTGMSDCLLATSVQEAAHFNLDTCGNGELDRGEECDLGPTSPSDAQFNRLMPCCNPTTCLASIDAVCTHGACCNNCEFVTRGTLCRAAQDQCDLPEFCTGTNPTCPADLYLENGSPCKTQPPKIAVADSHYQQETSSVDEAQALCYHGRCPTRESQCQSIWGSGARKAADYCFVLHNTRTEGACGVHGENCKLEHAMCGLLHCQGGKPRPVSTEAQAGQPFLTYTEHEGKQFECKHLSHVSTVRFVPEGAACAANRYCFHQQCVSPNVALRSQCPAAPVTRHMDDGRILVENVTCSNHGLCTNAGFCLCHPGWTDSVCHLPDATSPLSTKSGIQDSSSAWRSKYHPDPDIIKQIWSYREAMSRSGGLGFPYGEVSAGSKSPMNTIYLVAILGSVVGGMLVFLAIFMLIYRHRGRSGFPRKSHQSRCIFWTTKSHPTTTDSKGNGSLKLHSTVYQGRSRQYVALSPNSQRSLNDLSVESERLERTYLSRWANHHDRASPSGKKSHRHGDRRGSSAEHRHEHRKSGRRRRKHHGRDGDCRGNRRSGKRIESGFDPEHGRLFDGCIMNHSDTELTCKLQHSVALENASIDRSIKFGSMPSYKEDKLKQTKRPVDDRSGAHNGAVPTTTTAVLEGQVSFPTAPNGVELSFDPVLSAKDVTTTRSRGFPACSVTDVPSSLAPPPLFPHSDATAPYVQSVPGSSASQQPTACATAALVEAGKAGAAAAASIAAKCNSTLTQKDSDNIDETQFSIIMENSWRQPEKGILKNKNDGGGPTVSGNKSLQSRKCSDRDHGRRSRHNRHRRHHRRKRSRTRDLSDADRPSDDDCGLSRESSCSACSCCLREGDGQMGERCHSLPSHDQQRLCGISGRDNNLDGDIIHNDSSSNSSHSSSSSSFSPMNANLDLLSSSSSTTSTCSTALEVGPDGVRLGRLDDTNSERHQRPSDGKLRLRNRRGDHRSRPCSDGDPNQCEYENRSCSGHHRCGHQHRHRHYSRQEKNTCRRHHYRHREVEIEGAASSYGVSSSSGTVGALESLGSSSSTNPSSAVGLSAGSSSSSGMASGSGRHLHRCHRRVRARRSADDDGTTSGSRRSSLLHAVPTILCNAGQQTDELSLLRAAGLTVAPEQDNMHSTGGNQTALPEGGDSDAEWEEVECSESACEECQAAAKQVAVVHACPPPPKDQPLAIGHQYPLPNELNPSTNDQLTGHTNPAYVHTFRHNGDANMSNQSLTYQQQSTASSSLGSSKNSRIGTPALIPVHPIAFSTASTISPQDSSLAVGNVKGVMNQAASSSSSSSAVGHPSLFPRINTEPLKPMASDDFAGQHSETEVDAHLIQASGMGSPPGAFYAPIPQNPLKPPNFQQPCVQPSASMAPYTFVQPTYRPRPITGLREMFPVMADAKDQARPKPLVMHKYSANLTPMNPVNPSTTAYHVPVEHADAYYQHPYEDVATDDYTEAISGERSGVLQNQHIYHQHGIAIEGLSGSGYTKGDDDEDEERLSLDEGSSNANGIHSPALFMGRYASAQLPNSSSNYLRSPRATKHQSQWSNDTNGFRNTNPEFYVPPVTQFPGVESNPADVAKPATLSDLEDAGSEFSISAFRRDDIRIPFQQTSVNNGTGAMRGLSKLQAKQTLSATPDSGELVTDVRSNDGTCDESDASSLPEAGYDLVQLAQLDVSGRPNPLLSGLSRAYAHTNRWVPTTQAAQPSTASGPNVYNIRLTRTSFQPYLANEATQNPCIGSRSGSQPPDG